LAVQSLPFLAAVAVALLERTPLNSFATWQAIGARIGEFVPRRTANATASAEGTRQAVSEDRLDKAA